MPKKQQSRMGRFKRLQQLAEQNVTCGLSEAEALVLAEKAREEVYQLKQPKPAGSNAQ
ncbi:MAG: hypothetical protein HS126_04290 [Anaerolineales bacterium]|nr:hypothetical protein [Anaerolineales bacterium]